MLVVFVSAGYFAFCGWTEPKPRTWIYQFPADEMTGEKDYNTEKVISGPISIEGKPWQAGLVVFCYGEIRFFVAKSLSFNPGQFEQVLLDSIFSHELELNTIQLKLEFDNEILTAENLWQVAFLPSPREVSEWSDSKREKIMEKMEKHQEVIEEMTEHHHLWIGFKVQGIPYAAKFNLTGFSQELAKCSRGF